MTAEHTDESLVVDSVESGTEVEQHQSTDITVVNRSGNLVVDGNDGVPHRLLGVEMSFESVCGNTLYKF